MTDNSEELKRALANLQAIVVDMQGDYSPTVAFDAFAMTVGFWCMSAGPEHIEKLRARALRAIDYAIKNGVEA